MNDITFSLMQLYEDSSFEDERFTLPSQTDFYELEDRFYILIDDIYYESVVQKEDEYIWFVFDYGKPNPIDDKLTNIKDGSKKDNQRQSDEVELTSQLFILYSFVNNTLYISNTQKKSLLEKVLQQKLSRKFEVKSYFISKDQFMKTLKTVNKIYFTEVKDLFNQDSKKRQALIDLTGTNSPERFSIEASYKKDNKLIKFIDSLIESKSIHEIDSLVIQGTDEDDFNFVFNVDSFTKKVSFKIKKEENGKLDPDIVKISLLNEINI